jgi:hypothetical protein
VIFAAALRFAFAVFDIPEAIAVSRNAMCSNGGRGTDVGGLASVTRIQV